MQKRSRPRFYGEGLEGLMNARANDLWGIVNGLDYNDWNPDTDYRLAKNFNISNFRRNKPANKMALQEELGLDQDSHGDADRNCIPSDRPEGI